MRHQPAVERDAGFHAQDQELAQCPRHAVQSVLAIGGAGYISATGNLLPRKVASLYDLVTAGKWQEAQDLHYELMPLNDAVFLEINPVPVKTVLGWMGKICPEVRLPLAPLAAANEAKLRAVCMQYGLVQA